VVQRWVVCSAPGSATKSCVEFDFVAERTTDGCSFRILTLMDEWAHECLALPVLRKFKARDIQGIFADLFVERGCTEIYLFGQWAGVCSQRTQGLVAESRSQDSLYRARQSVGKRL
jgi:hypothetical protein